MTGNKPSLKGCGTPRKHSIMCIVLCTMCISLLSVISCSTEKNTPITRRVHAIKADYNTYYNGKVAFLEGNAAQLKANKDNHLEVLPLLTIGNKSTLSAGKANYARAIEKSKKAIKQHSITKRPQWNSNKPKTQKDKLWLSQREYNPFLYKAWFMMGESQLRQGEYLEAASTFAYMQRLYFSKPNIVAKARVLEALCYAEQDWHFQAEDLIARAERDSFPTKLNYMKAQVLADCNIRQKKYAEAIPYVQQVIKKQKGSYEKARLYYLLGQLYQQTGQEELAYKSFGKVIPKNPPYELAFNARIQQTEVLSKGNAKKMISKLRRMAKSSKNRDYLDRVYYAIGNIFLAQGDSTKAIDYYKTGIRKSTRSGPEKGVVWLRLGQLYWDKEKFAEAKDCYSGALGLFDKEHENYKEIDERSKILDELYPHAWAVELQDSLQELARMDSTERMAVIKRIIEDVKKQEKEEAAREAAAQTASNRQQNMARQNAGPNSRMNNQVTATWYFYNPTAVSSGQAEFQKKWGVRELADDWRRKNVTVLANDEEKADTIAADSISPALVDSLGNPVAIDSVAVDTAQVDTVLSEAERKRLEKLEEYRQDPHRPEYYLKDIPLTDEQMEASNTALVSGLFNSAIIYKDRMENFPLAERTFKRVLTQFPDYQHDGELYYNLFQLYSRIGEVDSAAIYKSKMQEEYPENPHTILISDPYFEYKGRFGRQIEDSIYLQTYEYYLADQYDSVVVNADYIAQEYPDGENRPRFMFLNVMSKLNLGERDQFLAGMKEIVEKYPRSTVSELAGLYVKGLQEGRLLASGKMDHGSLWDRRSGILADDADSVALDTTFTKEKAIPFVFVVAYERDSINENALLFEVANYNFSNFAVRNFDMNFVKGDGIDMFQVTGFTSYDEAYIYFNKLMNDERMPRVLEGLRLFIISEDNLKKLMHGLSFSDYFDFYEQNFDRIGQLQIDEELLDEPTDIPNIEDIPDEELQPEEEYDPTLDEENYIF